MFIELTDFFHPTLKEYVDADSVARVENATERVLTGKMKTTEVTHTRPKNGLFSFFSKEKETYTQLHSEPEFEIVHGSLVYMKGGKDKTYVRELPDVVLQMITNAKTGAK